MSGDILMPALSPTMEEGKLAAWLVKRGDSIAAGDVILEVETDKATMEVEAPESGTLQAILVPSGSEGVKVGTVIARLGAARQAETQMNAETAPEHGKSEEKQIQPVPQDLPADARRAIAATPLARSFARASGLDLAAAKASGIDGTIKLVDVAPRHRTSRQGMPRGGETDPASGLGVPGDSHELVPLNAMRKTIARRLTESARDIPHFPVSIEFEIDEILAVRSRLNHIHQQDKLSVNDFVIRAAALALLRVPDANVSFSPDGIARHKHADIAVAVAIDGGLIAPVIRSAENKSVGRISKEMKELAERARARRLKPEEYQGGTFSISNLGMHGVRQFSSILTPPQSCILSVGAIEKRPVERDDAVALAQVINVTLTCDHRAIDGAIAAAWLNVFKSLLADPLLMI